eukprot:71758-Pyramimonas_sp.AAC.1
MRQRASEADEHVCNQLGCLSASASAGNIAVLILGIYHITIGACVFVEFTLAQSVLDAIDVFVHGVPSAGHIDGIDMFGREQVAARLELLVVGRGSETRPSGGPSEL